MAWEGGPGSVVVDSSAPLPSDSENPPTPSPLCPGAMALAGAQGTLWSVEGGNKLVCSGLLKLSKANVIHAMVTSVTLQHTGEWREQGAWPLLS